MAAVNVPHLVKHTTLAIWRDGGISGGNRERFISAWNIARARLTQYGYLASGSDTGKAVDIKLTSKGVARDREHARESDGRAKSALFDSMFKWIEVAEDTKTAQDKDPGAKQLVNQADRGDAARVRQDNSVLAPRINTPNKVSRNAPTKPVKKTVRQDKPKPSSPFDRKHSR